MKTFRTLFLSFMLIMGIGLMSSLSAQSIYFCEGVDSNGQPINASTRFNIPRDGGYLYVLVQLPYEYYCSYADFDIYLDGDYNTTISMDTQENWSWFYKQITFYQSGEFDIKVYDCDEELVVSGTLQIDME